MHRDLHGGDESITASLGFPDGQGKIDGVVMLGSDLHSQSHLESIYRIPRLRRHLPLTDTSHLYCSSGAMRLSPHRMSSLDSVLQSISTTVLFLCDRILLRRYRTFLPFPRTGQF